MPWTKHHLLGVSERKIQEKRPKSCLKYIPCIPIWCLDFKGANPKSDATNVAFENTGVGSDESNQNASCKVLGFPGVCISSQPKNPPEVPNFGGPFSCWKEVGISRTTNPYP